MKFINKTSSLLLAAALAICSQGYAAQKTSEPTCSDKTGVVERVNDQIADTFSPEKRAKIVKKLKEKLNKKGEKAKLIKQLRRAEEDLITTIVETDELLVKDIKSGKIIDSADEAVAKLTSEENRNKIMESLKDAFDQEKEDEIRENIANSNLTDKQKAALQELLDLLHCEVSKIPVE